MRMAVLVMLLLAVGCKSTSAPPEAKGPRTSELVQRVASGVERADAKLVKAQPLIVSIPIAAEAVSGARTDLAETRKDIATAGKQSNLDEKQAGKLAEENRELKADDPQLQRLERTSYLLYIAAAVLLVAIWFFRTVWKQLMAGSLVCLLFGALFSGLAYWGKTVAAITLGLFGVVALAALLSGVWYVVHLWSKHRAEIERRLLGVKP